MHYIPILNFEHLIGNLKKNNLMSILKDPKGICPSSSYLAKAVKLLVEWMAVRFKNGLSHISLILLADKKEHKPG